MADRSDPAARFWLHGWRDEYEPGTQQAWIAQVGGKPVRIW